MKTIIFITMLLFACLSTQAQTWGEWFSQKKTQKKYLLEQIAALQAYIGFVKKGNEVLKDGTGLISNIKSGDLKLHGDHFAGLKLVSSAIANSSQVKAIIRMYEDISQGQRRTISKAMESRQFSAPEITSLKRRFKDLATEAEKDIDELKLVVTDGKLELTDDQRIKAIDRLYRSMQHKYMSQKIWNSDILALAQARIQGARDAAIFKSIQGLEP